MILAMLRSLGGDSGDEHKKKKKDTPFLMMRFACGGLHTVLLINASFFFIYMRIDSNWLLVAWKEKEVLHISMTRRQ